MCTVGNIFVFENSDTVIVIKEELTYEQYLEVLSCTNRRAGDIRRNLIDKGYTVLPHKEVYRN